MKIFDNLDLEIYGSSHSSEIGFILKGIKKGYKIDFTKIDELLVQRKGNVKYNTTRNELENYEFLKGVEKQITTGEDIHLEIKQTNFKSSDYIKGVVRPSHADLSAYLKYGDKYDYKGGGPFSGRMTILYVIAGEIARQILHAQEIDIEVFYQIKKVLNFIDDDINNMSKSQLKKLNQKQLPISNEEVHGQVEKLLLTLKESKDSVGALLTFKVFGVNKNYGDLYLNSFESKLSSLLYSVPAVKSVSFGLGEKFTEYYGKEVLERLNAIDSKVISATNYNGGVNGGITNGVQEVVFSCTVKPTATLFDTIETVKYENNMFSNAKIKMQGRHDAFIANRASFAIIGLTYLLFLDYN